MKKLRQAGQPHGYLAGKSLGMIFQHPSTRTRVAFEAGMAQLGGQAIFLGVHDLQIKRGESLADTAQVLSRYVDGIVARVAAHSDIEEIAAASSVPVLNGLSDRCHPMQALSDLLTMQEVFGGLRRTQGRLSRRRQQHGPLAPARLRGDGHERLRGVARGLPARSRGRQSRPLAGGHQRRTTPRSS